ncbi:MAG: hypothetical protein J7498_01595 [Sphingobium sp.]|nr:hypothetical protein [Sphingobium sp.]
MRRPSLPNPDQFKLRLAADEDLERIIEARVAERCEAESIRWRFRLVTIETAMVGALVTAAGLALEQPTMLVLRAAVIVAGSCLASGILLIGLSAWSSKLLIRWTRWRAR